MPIRTVSPAWSSSRELSSERRSATAGAPIRRDSGATAQRARVRPRAERNSWKRISELTLATG
ncbi:hypothetical protein AB0399_36300 [Streptomyces sp. NPDC088194]|uniref:hypothetical protein n=1 Tax=Streptomyces sp. NPDC088194 TaxID=3154931 RepID=UPI00344B92A8